MTLEVGGVRLKTPVMAASGTFGYGTEAPLCDRTALGGMVSKGIFLQPRPGTPPPRIVETPSGMLNAIGLQGPGVEALIRDYAPLWATWDLPVLVNLNGETVDEYGELAARLDGVPGVAGVEVNISCPNVKHGGIVFGTDPKAAYEVVKLVREATIKPLIVKLSPNVTDIVEMASACADAGADALSLINTVTGMAVDLQKRRPVLANITGGLSGPGIKPIALRMVWQVAKAVNLPIIGIGGIMSATDALEFMLVGATAVQIGTANFLDPSAAQTIARDMEQYLADNGISDVKTLIGALEFN